MSDRGRSRPQSINVSNIAVSGNASVQRITAVNATFDSLSVVGELAGAVTLIETENGIVGGPITGAGTVGLDVDSLSEQTDILADDMLIAQTGAGAPFKITAKNLANLPVSVDDAGDVAPLGVPTASTTSAACSWGLSVTASTSTGTCEVAGDTIVTSKYTSLVEVPIYDRTVSGTGTQTKSVSLPATTGSYGAVRHDAAGVAQSVWTFPTAESNVISFSSADGGFYITFNYDAANTSVYPFSATGEQSGTPLSLPAPTGTSAIAIVKFSALGVPTKAAVVQGIGASFQYITDDPSTGQTWLGVRTNSSPGTATVYDFSSNGTYVASNTVTFTPLTTDYGGIVRFSAGGVAEVATVVSGTMFDIQIGGDYVYICLWDSSVTTTGIPNMTADESGTVVVTSPARVGTSTCSLIVKINTQTGVIHSCAAIQGINASVLVYAAAVVGNKLYVPVRQSASNTTLTIRDFGSTGGDVSATVTSAAGVGCIIEYDTVTGMATRCANNSMQIFSASVCDDTVIFSGRISTDLTASQYTNYNLGLNGSTSVSPVATPVGVSGVPLATRGATIAYSTETGYALGLFVNPWTASLQTAVFNGPSQIVVTGVGNNQAGPTALPSMSVDGTPTTLVQYPTVSGGMASIQMLYTPPERVYSSEKQMVSYVQTSARATPVMLVDDTVPSRTRTVFAKPLTLTTFVYIPSAGWIDSP